MTNETFRILLEAKNPEKGICEFTGSDAGQDVFSQWSIDVSGGRIGRRGRSSPTPLRMIRASCPPWDLARMVQAVLQRRLISIMRPATFAELATGVPRSTRQPAFARAGINLAIFLATVRAEAHFVDPRPTVQRVPVLSVAEFADMLKRT